ncbi:MAG: hypothetical protein HY835_05180 [Anaerolineae bacterium]|nr:hypothetical protein [Anaerolineae bacterium]
MKKPIHITALIFVISLVWVLGGCSWEFPGRTTETPVAEPGSILMEDDFSQPPSGWGIYQTDAAAITYESEHLRVAINAPNTNAWSTPGRSFDDVIVDAQAAVGDGPQNNLLGLICRYQDRENFYVLFVSSDGYYGIARVEDGQYRLIGAEQLQYNALLIKDQRVVDLKIECVGDQLSLFADGERLSSVVDAAYASGDVGVFAGVYAEAGLDVWFDNFRVTQP